MVNGRQFAFWLVILGVLAAALWLLHDVLLPFVTGIALAYVLAPLADRAQRLGMNRTIVALLIVGAFVVSLIILILLVVRLLLHQGPACISPIPDSLKCVKRLI